MFGETKEVGLNDQVVVRRGGLGWFLIGIVFTFAALFVGGYVYLRFCHGTPGIDSTIGRYEYPVVPQLWKPHGHSGVVGVSDDEAGETYWKVKNGIRLTGMPAFEKTLSTDDMWRVSLLVKSADKPLEADVASALNGH